MAIQHANKHHAYGIKCKEAEGGVEGIVRCIWTNAVGQLASKRQRVILHDSMEPTSREAQIRAETSAVEQQTFDAWKAMMGEGFQDQ
jgi:hypothetical protein